MSGVRVSRAPAQPPYGPLRPLERVALGLLFVALSLVMLGLTPARLTSRLPANLGDPALISWLMDWAGHAVVTDPLDYFDAPIFWPNHDTAAYTDSLLPLAAVFGPVHAMAGSASWALAFNVTLVSLVVGNLAATFALVRWFTGRADAALVAALGFSFSSYFLGHLANPHLFGSCFLPLGFLLLFRVLNRPRLPEAVALGLVTVAQVLAAAYYGVLWGLSAVIVVAGWLLARRGLTWLQLRALAVSAAVAGVLLVPLTAPYLALQGDARFSRPLSAGEGLSPADLLTPANGNWAWHLLAQVFPDHNEHVAFPGLLMTLLFLAGLAHVFGRHRRPVDIRTVAGEGAGTEGAGTEGAGTEDAVTEGAGTETGTGPAADRRLALLLLIVAGATATVLSVGPVFAGRTAPFAFFYSHVPGFSGIRVPARLAVLTMLTGAVLAGVGFAAMTAQQRPLLRRRLTVAACLIVLAEMAAPTPWVDLPVDDDTLAVYRALDGRGPGVVLELPIPNPELSPDYPFVEAPRQLYATLDRHPRVNGYSGYLPPGYVADTELLARFPAPGALARLRELQVRWVVLHGGPVAVTGAYGPGARAQILAELPASVAVTPLGDDDLLELTA